MVEVSNTIRNKKLAETLAYKEKPYRDLAAEVLEMRERPGMLRAYSTLVDLAEHRANLYVQKTPFTEFTRNPHTLPDSQAHIANAAHEYVRVVEGLEEVPKLAVVYNEPNAPEGDPTVANRANEILTMWGADGEYGQKAEYASRINEVKLRVQDHNGVVTLFAVNTRA